MEGLLVRTEHVRESERIAIARQLHDDFSQLLLGARMRVDVLKRSLAPASEGVAGGPSVEALDQVLEQLNQRAAEVIDELRDPEASWRPLEDIVASALASFRALDALGFEVDVSGRRPLSPEVAEVVARTLQEALTNIFKHARARRVAIVARVTPDTIRLAIHDDGRGFSSDGAPGGWGLVGMRERAASVRGTLTVRSGEGGTEVELVVPLDEEVSAAQ
ncbi:MAG: ATP-binding protein [Myxococcota bacterium]